MAPADLVARLSAAPGSRVTYDTRDPLGVPLRAMAYQAQIPGRPAPVIFMTAEDRTPIDRDVRSFAFATAVFFLLLALTMAVAVVLQVRVGLRPLFNLRREIADVRQGKADRLQEAYPVELEPLADELNALMAHNQEVVERQRTHVGNLAHALKTPLSVIQTEAAQQPGALAEVVTRQADVMRQQVDHHLRRARAAARARRRWWSTWSRMALACRETTSASSPGCLCASVSITEIGVFRACARLPTWVRWRSTTSWLWSSRALSSSASGEISSG